MKRIWERTKDYFAMIGAVLLQAPNRRFDVIVGSGKDEYIDIIGSTAVVTEVVTETSGKVRYAGVMWRARLSENTTCADISIGEEVTIKSSEGNILIVE